MKPDVTRCARHEAAHVVAAAVLGVKLDSVSVAQNDAGNITGVVRAASPANIAHDIAAGITPAGPPDRQTRRLCARHLVVRLGGLAADRLAGVLAADPTETAGDWRSSRRLAQVIAPEQPEQCLAWYMAVATRILRRYVASGLVRELGAAIVAAPGMGLTGDDLKCWVTRVVWESRLSPQPSVNPRQPDEGHEDAP